MKILGKTSFQQSSERGVNGYHTGSIQMAPFVSRFPEISARLLAAISMMPHASDCDWPRVGDLIHEHKIIRSLGFGKTSRVYLTEDVTAGGRATVLKITTGPTNEAIYLARFNHPSVCTLYQAGVDSRHIHLQYASGPNGMSFLNSRGGASDETTRGSAPSREYCQRVVMALTCVASAIDHIHIRGVAHNDIKPSNIVFGANETLLIDFDAASEVGVHGARRSIGTIDYLSNESLSELASSGQLIGQNCISDDYFAFAVTCFEMLVGTLPWTKHFSNVSPDLCNSLLKERKLVFLNSAMATAMPDGMMEIFFYIFDATMPPPHPVHLARVIRDKYGFTNDSLHTQLNVETGPPHLNSAGIPLDSEVCFGFDGTFQWLIIDPCEKTARFRCGGPER